MGAGSFDPAFALAKVYRNSFGGFSPIARRSRTETRSEEDFSDNVVIKIILRKEASARRASIHVDSYQPELIESLAQQAIPAVMAGPVLVREN